MSDDWLEVEEKPSLIPTVAVPAEYDSRLVLLSKCWSRLSVKQKRFLGALRENRLNARRAARSLNGEVARESHVKWMHEKNYATVVKIWQADVALDALDRDRLLGRQDDIVETLMTPKPILHQGQHTGFEEVEAGAASRANEVLMKAAGLLKDKDVDVNVGIVGPSFVIQVVQKDGTILDATPKGITVDLPVIDTDWPSES